MKAKVLEKFKDKHTGKIHKVGSVINVTKERYDEILEVGKYVEKVTDADAQTEPTEAPKKRTTTKKAE